MERPKIKLALTTGDLIIEIVGWLLMLAVWVLTITAYSGLADIIPIHYNSSGEADGFGAKATILSLPVISTMLFIGLTILNKFPHKFNYLTEINQDNAYSQYRYACRLIRTLKLIIVLIFGLIVYMTIQHAKGAADGLGYWFLPFTLAMIFIPLMYYVFKSSKAKAG
jgi:uncharacterized membrane protein